MKVVCKEVNFGFFKSNNGEYKHYHVESEEFDCSLDGCTEHYCWWYIGEKLPKELDESISYVYIDTEYKQVEVSLSVNKDEFLRLVYRIV